MFMQILDALSGVRRDNRQTLARLDNGDILALQIPTGKVNHKKIIHGVQIPHRNPIVEYHRVPIKRWWGGVRYENVAYSLYPITDDPISPLDMNALLVKVAEAQAKGWDVQLVGLNQEQAVHVIATEDNTQEARGANILENEYLSDRNIRQPEQKKRSRAILNRIFE